MALESGELKLTDLELLLVYLATQKKPKTLQEIRKDIENGGLQKLPNPFDKVKFSFEDDLEKGLESNLYALVGDNAVEMVVESPLRFSVSDLGMEEYKVIRRVTRGYDNKVEGKAIDTDMIMTTM